MGVCANTMGVRMCSTASMSAHTHCTAWLLVKLMAHQRMCSMIDISTHTGMGVTHDDITVHKMYECVCMCASRVAVSAVISSAGSRGTPSPCSQSLSVSPPGWTWSVRVREMGGRG